MIKHKPVFLPKQKYYLVYAPNFSMHPLNMPRQVISPLEPLFRIFTPFYRTQAPSTNHKRPIVTTLNMVNINVSLHLSILCRPVSAVRDRAFDGLDMLFHVPAIQKVMVSGSDRRAAGRTTYFNWCFLRKLLLQKVHASLDSEGGGSGGRRGVCIG